MFVMTAYEIDLSVYTGIYLLVAVKKGIVNRGLPVGFLLLQYSVLFTVESLSLLYLLVIS